MLAGEPICNLLQPYLQRSAALLQPFSTRGGNGGNMGRGRPRYPSLQPRETLKTARAWAASSTLSATLPATVVCRTATWGAATRKVVAPIDLDDGAAASGSLDFCISLKRQLRAWRTTEPQSSAGRVRNCPRADPAPSACLLHCHRRRESASRWRGACQPHTGRRISSAPHDTAWGLSCGPS